jgi:hypothetical protein
MDLPSAPQHIVILGSLGAGQWRSAASGGSKSAIKLPMYGARLKLGRRKSGMRADLVLWPTTVRRTAFLFCANCQGMGFRIVSFEGMTMLGMSRAVRWCRYMAFVNGVVESVAKRLSEG